MTEVSAKIGGTVAGDGAARSPQPRGPEVSVVIPVKDEVGSLEELHGQLVTSLTEATESYEIIFVDDGSTDGSVDVMLGLQEQDPNVSVIQFRRNFGKAAALSAGFDAAKGRVVITMDADLQDDPKEIPHFLEKIDSGCDLVCGWKKKRHDPLSKRLPSRLFNRVTSWVTGVRLHDFNCGFKAYRSDALRHIEIYGDLHRYIPALAASKGFRIGEIVVQHHPRRFGKSKYGLERLARGFFDLLTIVLITTFSKRPLHFFGMIGLFIGLLGAAALAYLSVLWVLGSGPIGGRPLLSFGVLCVISGTQVVSLGMLGEMITYHYHGRRDTESLIARKLPGAWS